MIIFRVDGMRIVHALDWLGVFVGSTCRAEIVVPRLIGSNMVLQRESNVKLWGWGEAGEEVEIVCDWLDSTVKVVTTQEGVWSAEVATGSSGESHRIELRGTNQIILENILFGEVWIGSGQSNMEMPLRAISGAYTGIHDAEEEIAAANYPEIRLFQVGNYSSDSPLDDVETGISMYGVPPAKCEWLECSKDNVGTFASTAYFFAEALHKKLGVPVGIIDASWGGTSAEAWTPVDGLIECGLEKDVVRARTAPQQADQKIPSRLYNGMIHPLRQFKVRGCIWYQGESNTSRAEGYHQLFTTMIKQWRRAFNDELSFYFVQLAPYRYGDVNSALLREAQLDTLKLPRTGMVVTTDIGNFTDIHPKNKREVGRRLSLHALANDYGLDIAHSGPTYRACEIIGNEISVQFDHSEGLKAKGGSPLRGFEIAGVDGVFAEAAARLDGKAVVIGASKVAMPRAVRYAFTNEADGNLVNAAGLPASSFRTLRSSKNNGDGE